MSLMQIVSVGETGPTGRTGSQPVGEVASTAPPASTICALNLPTCGSLPVLVLFTHPSVEKRAAVLVCAHSSSPASVPAGPGLSPTRCSGVGALALHPPGPPAPEFELWPNVCA